MAERGMRSAERSGCSRWRCVAWGAPGRRGAARRDRRHQARRARLHRGAHRDAGHRRRDHQRGAPNRASSQRSLTFPVSAHRSPAPEPHVRRGGARSRPRPAGEGGLRSVRAARLPAVRDPQAQLRAHLPRRVRRRVRLRSVRVPDGAPVLQPALRAAAAVSRLSSPPTSAPRAAGCASIAVLRNRLFQAYLQVEVGRLFLRFGRQILAWGETDIFRLLDNINPLDNSFGGFLVPLDERRVPIDMLRASYSFGEIPWTPFYEAYIEGFAAIDNAVGYSPGIPDRLAVAAAELRAVGDPAQLRATSRRARSSTCAAARSSSSSRRCPAIETATFGLAHYYTYVDNPAVQVQTQNFPVADHRPANRARGFNALAVQTAPQVQITGATRVVRHPAGMGAARSFLSSEPIVRTELAYFHNEPRWSQAQLDPFVFALPQTAAGPCPAPGRHRRPNGFCTRPRAHRRLVEPDGRVRHAAARSASSIPTRRSSSPRSSSTSTCATRCSAARSDAAAAAARATGRSSTARCCR